MANILKIQCRRQRDGQMDKQTDICMYYKTFHQGQAYTNQSQYNGAKSFIVGSGNVHNKPWGTFHIKITEIPATKDVSMNN